MLCAEFNSEKKMISANVHLKHARYIAAETTAAIISAAAAIGSAGINSFTAGKMNHKSFKRNKWLMEHQTELNKQLWEYQYGKELETYEKYRSPEALARQYAEAGMNPYLAANGSSVGSVSTPTVGSTGIVNSQPVTDTGWGDLGGTAGKTAQAFADADLKRDQAKTEEKKQVYYENTAQLQKALEGKATAETAYQNVITFNTTDLHGLNVQQKQLEIQKLMGGLQLLNLRVQDMDFKVTVLNDLQRDQMVAENAYLTAGAMLRIATFDAEVQLSFGQAQLIQEYVQNQYYERNLMQARAYEAYKAGDVNLWEAGIRKQMHDNNYGVHRAESEYWHGRKTMREYKWMPAMNVTKMVGTVGDLAFRAIEMFTPAGIAGKLTQALKGAQRQMYEGLASPKNLQNSGKWSVGKDDVLYHMPF